MIYIFNFNYSSYGLIECGTLLVCNLHKTPLPTGGGAVSTVIAVRKRRV